MDVLPLKIRSLFDCMSGLLSCESEVFEPVSFKWSEDVLGQKFQRFFYRRNVFACLTLHFHLKEVPS